MKKFLKTLLIILLAAAVLYGGYLAYTWYAGAGSDVESADASGDGTLVSEDSDLEDSGITGEGYTFDTLYYPYYAMLDETQQAFYAQVCANANALADTFVPVTQCTVDDVTAVMEAVFYDHPEYFWLETSYTYKYTADGTCVQIILNFYDLAEDIDTAQALFDAAVQTIVDGAAAQDTDYEKEKYVHDAIIALASYDEEADYHQSAYSALVTGRTVCAGYAHAFQYIMTRLGIPTYYCTGYSDGDHAWNIVMLDDGYYNVDLTWDDSDPVSYLFFNCTDADFASTHTRSELSENLPACTATSYSGLENTGGPGSYPGSQTPAGSGNSAGSSAGSTDSGTSGSDSSTDGGTSGSDSGTDGGTTDSDASDSESGTDSDSTDSSAPDQTVTPGNPPGSSSETSNRSSGSTSLPGTGTE